MATFTFGGAPPPEVSAYFADKNLRPAFRWSEVWGQEHAYAFTVAKATSLDVLSAIKESLQKAIDEGVPYSTWSKNLQPELERLGWWGVKEMPDPATGEIKPVQLGSARRLATIYDANLRTARAAGQWERAQRTKGVLPYFSYQLGPSMHHRPEHEAREGMIAPVDSPIWDAWYPPNGWGCKCWLMQITRSAAEAAGGATDLGDIEDGAELPMRRFTRRRDDGSEETIRVPKGIDPGWGNNPGKARAATLMQSLTDKLNAAGPDVAKAAIADLWRGPTARTLPNIPQRFFAPVAVATPALKAALGASADVVMVGSDTMGVKLGKHGQGSRGLTPDDFGKVQAILADGRQLRSKGGRETVVAQLADGWWQAVFKTDATKRELILVTLHPILERRAKSILGK